MDEIINKILSLPDLILHVDQLGVDSPQIWKQFSLFFNSLPEKSANTLRETLRNEDPDNFSKNTHYQKVIQFVTIWLEITEMLQAWTIEISEVWQAVTAQPLVADDLVPMTAELLPNDFARLRILQSKLDSAARLTDTSAHGYALANFQIAVHYKIRCLEENQSTIPKSDASTDKLATNDRVKDYLIGRVANELSIHNDLKKLIQPCIECKYSLQNAYIKAFKTHAITAYDDILQNINNDIADIDNQIIYESIMSHQDQAIIIDFDPELDLLRLQCLLINDILYSLIRVDICPTQKLHEVVEKFEAHLEVLAKNIPPKSESMLQSTTSFWGINRVYDYMGWHSKKDSFIATTGLFCKRQRIKFDADVLQNSPLNISAANPTL